MSTTRHLDKLNAPQRKAVTYGEPLPDKGYRAGPLLIVAGAGTGKTDTLAHRVAHLVINGVDPARILMLTFTRRAALEMRRRAQDITRKALDDALGGVSQSISQRLSWAGTFHSIGNRLLRHYAAHVQLDPHFSVIDRGDAADLMDSLRQELGLAGKEQRFPRSETCLQIYSNRVNTRAPLKEALEQQYPWCAQWEEELTRLYRAYVEQKQHAHLLDYDDLLLYWHAMMGEARLAQHIGAHFDHVLVDEYQDTNRLQAEILHALRPDGAGLAVVGDDAQAIYSFRAAAVENILGFPERFDPPAEVVTLAQNYRSTQQVLDVANAVMAEAPRQHRKYLLSIRGQGARPRLVTVDELQTQAEYVCTEVLKRREANVPLKRQAVLFRSGSHSDMLEVELAKRKIPYVKYGGLKFLEAAHIKDLLAVLRWADNPRNALAAFRALQLLPGMGPVNARAAIEHFEAGGHSFTALKGFTPPQTGELDWRRLVELLQTLADPQTALAGAGESGARVVPAALRAPVRAVPHAPRRPRPAGDALRAVPFARALRHRAHPRSAARHQRPVRPPDARRGLPGAVHHPLRQGHGVGHGVPAQRGRRQLSVRVRHRQAGAHRGGAAPAVRGAHARAERAGARHAAEVPSHAAVAHRRCAPLRRPQPLHDRQGAQDTRCGHLPQRHAGGRGLAAGGQRTGHGGRERAAARYVVSPSGPA